MSGARPAVATADAAGGAVPASCYHCNLPVPPGSNFVIQLQGQERSMCCPGCLAVAEMIDDCGLQRFYERRTAFNPRPAEVGGGIQREALALYDDPAFTASFCSLSRGSAHATLMVGGITCAACTWLIERALRREAGVHRAAVSLDQSRLDVYFEPAVTPLSRLVAVVNALGYRVRPWKEAARRRMLEDEQRASLRRLAAAGLGMMQVGMFAIALHAGDLQGMAPEYRHLLRWVSLVVATFVVFYAARPFFETAWRHLRAGTLVMDLPVALAIGLAWTASLLATLTRSGQVYFDSIVMFTFFLLLARFLEQRLRLRAQRERADAEDALPDMVRIPAEGGWRMADRRGLQVGQRILVAAGDMVPVDGTVLAGTGTVEESAFTGEALPRPVKPGATVYAGTVNHGDALEIEAATTWDQTRLAALQQTVALAERDRPALARLADRVAAWFVGAILLITAGTAALWIQIDASRALWVALSVLVVSCPCALSLATPTALTSAANALRRRGVVVRGDDALEALARATHFVFDKTGTLTAGSFTVSRVSLPGDIGREEALALVAALQHHAAHPVASAFAGLPVAAGFSAVSFRAGAGLEGKRSGQRYRVGSGRWCREIAPAMASPPDDEHYWIGLCREDRPLAWIGLTDHPRTEARAVLDALREAGRHTSMLSGDASPRALALARALGMDVAVNDCSPAEKVCHVRRLQRGGAVVAMVGDGLNDAPVLGVADTSMAVAGATDLARTRSDFAVASGDLGNVLTAWHKALACRRVVMQNFAWALGYNLCALPLAVAGLIPPWAAALGMSASSLLVVSNSLRLGR